MKEFGMWYKELNPYSTLVKWIHPHATRWWGTSIFSTVNILLQTTANTWNHKYVIHFANWQVHIIKCNWGQVVDMHTFLSTASSDLSGGRASAKSIVFREIGFLPLPPLPPLSTPPSLPCSCGTVSERLWCFFVKFFLPGFQMSTGEKVTSSWSLILLSSSSSSSNVIWTKLNDFLTLGDSPWDLHNDKGQAHS